MTLVVRINNHLYYYNYKSLFKPRASQRLSSQSNDHNTYPIDPHSEIDRRNQRVLYPLNAKESYGAEKSHSTFHYQKAKFSSNSFNLESYNTYSHSPHSSQRTTDEHLLNRSSIYYQPSYEKRTIINSDSSFLYGNSIIKTNKADILHFFEQQKSNTGENSNNYINKYGVIINTDGPFWPCDYRILYPTPKLLTREFTPKEFYFTVLLSKLKSIV